MTQDAVMSPLEVQDFELGEVTLERVLDALATDHHSEPSESTWAIFYDTFDWRLWRAGTQLIEQRRLGRREFSWHNIDASPRHLWVLSDDESIGLVDDSCRTDIRRALRPIVSMRRLMPVLRIDQNGRLVRVLDAEQKTVARLRLMALNVSSPTLEPMRHPQPLKKRLRLESVRGYQADRKRVAQVLTKKLALKPCKLSLFAAGVSALGRQPGDYSSKVRLELDSTMSALDAARHIHQSLLETIEINLDGVRRDLDSEFLHDFRVAVRRTRSALGQIKGVFADAAVADFKARFSWLGKVTGPTRDLDVYLLKLPAYRADLPIDVAHDLEPLEVFLAQRQQEEQQELARELDSDTFKRLIAEWRAFLAQPSPGAKAKNPVLQVASSRIWKSYRKIVAHASVITPQTPATHVHEVRLMAKKLRYLMEFFRNLYAATAIDVSIRELKRLQDSLGDFNDYEVQQASLGDLAEEMKLRGLATAPTLLAMGRLQARLADGQAAERRRLDERFERFLSAANQTRFKQLFAR